MNELLTMSSLYCSRPRSRRSTYSYRSIDQSPSRSESRIRVQREYTTSKVFDKPREYSGSMKPAACDIRHQRGPIDCDEEYCRRSVETHSRTRCAPSNWRLTAG